MADLTSGKVPIASGATQVIDSSISIATTIASFAGGVIKLTANVAVGSLPTPALGMFTVVNDADTPVIGEVVVGGASAKALVWYNGAAWTVIGV